MDIIVCSRGANKSGLNDRLSTSLSVHPSPSKRRENEHPGQSLSPLSSSHLSIYPLIRLISRNTGKKQMTQWLHFSLCLSAAASTPHIKHFQDLSVNVHVPFVNILVQLETLQRNQNMFLSKPLFHFKWKCNRMLKYKSGKLAQAKSPGSDSVAIHFLERPRLPHIALPLSKHSVPLPLADAKPSNPFIGCCRGSGREEVKVELKGAAVHSQWETRVT